MKKILIITYTHSNGGGAENVLTTFVNNLDSKKYEVTIQEIDYFGVKREELNNNIKKKKIPLCNTTKRDLFANINRYFLYNNPNILKSVFNWYGYDIIIAWNYQLPSFALRAFTEEFTISHYHTDIYDLNIKKHPEQKNNFELQVRVWEKVDVITTICNRSKQSLMDLCPQFIDKVRFLHNGTDIKKIQNNSTLAFEKEVIFKKESLRLISIGRLDKNKNFSLVLKAIQILVKKGFEIDYLVLGIGDQENELRNEAKDLEITDNVHFLGYIQNPYPYIKNSDVLCLSSYSEGWGMVIVEAMILGKPFITTPVSGASEELCNNEKCGLVSSWNPIEYASKIEKLYLDKKLRDTLGNNGKEYIKNYSIEATQKEFEDLISCSNLKNNLNNKNIFLNLVKYILLYSSSLLCLRGRYNNLKNNNGNNFFNIIKLSFTFIEIPLMFIPKFLHSIYYCNNTRKLK